MEWDSSTAFTTRPAYDWPSKNFCTPATIAAAAERCPPPVSDEIIRILGMRCDTGKNRSLYFVLCSCCLLFAVYCLLFTVYCLLFTASTLCPSCLLLQAATDPSLFAPSSFPFPAS